MPRKKLLFAVIALIFMLCTTTMLACDKVEFIINFECDGEIIDSINTNGQEVIAMPENPTKDGYVFAGWYWDKDIWEQPFTVNSLLDVTLQSDMTVYAHFVKPDDIPEYTEGLAFTLQTSSNSYMVTGYDGTASEIVIPSTYKTLDVTSIGTRAFAGNALITKVSIPDTVVTVGLGAFSECYLLKEVKMSQNIQLLGASAFSNCIALKKIDLPDTLINIGGEAFFGCLCLEEIYISSNITNIGTNIIRGCNSLKKLTFPSEIALISFVGDSIANVPNTLKEIYFSYGSAQITADTLASASMVEKVVIPDSITKIESDSFADCNIKDLTMPFSIIGRYGSPADKLESLNYFGTGDEIPDHAFDGCINLSQINGTNGHFIIPDGVTNVGYNAFNNCKSLNSISIPDSITSIESSAFSGCGLSKVFISDIDKWCSIQFGYETSNPLYGADLYLNDKLLTELTISKEISAIKSYTFIGCASLTDLIIEASSIGHKAFSQCVNLTNLTIKPATTTMLSRAFSGCSNLRNVQFAANSSLNTINEFAFSDCSELTNIEIPNSVSSIGKSAFQNCNKLERISLPFVGESNAPTTSKSNYFGYIFGAVDSAEAYKYVPWNLKTVTITGANLSSSFSFARCQALTTITLPEGLEIIGPSAFGYCYSLKNIIIPNSARFIYGGAFTECTKLKSIIFKNPTNWYRTNSLADAIEKKSGINTDLSSEIDNATYFVSIYKGYTWYKI